MIFDTHAHYDDRQFEEDREELLGSMRENGVELIVDAGSDIASWDKIEQLTDRYPFIYGAIGVHPDEVDEADGTTACQGKDGRCRRDRTGLLLG